MSYYHRIAAAVAATVLLLAAQNVFACTGITLTGQDGDVVRSRTLEWEEFNLHCRLDIVPRGCALQAEKMPDKTAGKYWTVKYGFVGVSILDKTSFIDGINESGLSAGAFYLPGYSKYPDYDPEQAANTLAPTDLLGYLLGQCKSVDDVREAVASVRVAPVVEPSLNIVADMHIIVTEPSGKSIVIEYIDKKPVIFDAPLGVITNSPNYDWHMTNLKNYINLSNTDISSKKIGPLTLKPIGVGSGLLGLPGDFTPPSRFVRAVAFTQGARKTTGGYDTVRESFRILDNFNVPTEGAKDLASGTQITTSADTKNKIFYYHTQYNRRTRMIDLKKIDFGKIGAKMLSRPADKSQQDDIREIKLSR
jgi:choloylglycine hydrolase